VLFFKLFYKYFQKMEKFNDRIDFLWHTLGYKSSREFDRTLGIPEKQTSSITGPKQSLPRIDYVQRIVEVHPEVNANWLLVGGSEWKNPPKNYLEELKRKIEELSSSLEKLSKEKEEVLEENSVFRNSIINLAINRPANFHPVSNKKTPAKKRGTVMQLPLFARSVANSAWLRAL
jgi:hypothetical protein